MAVAYQNVKESRHDRKFQKEELYNNWENVNIVSLNTDWIKFMDNHKLHLGIDGTLSFLKSTANTENVLTGETSYNTTRYPDGSNSMHTIEHLPHTCGTSVRSGACTTECASLCHHLFERAQR